MLRASLGLVLYTLEGALATTHALFTCGQAIVNPLDTGHGKGHSLNSDARECKLLLRPNPPKDTDGRREGSGRGVRELQGK